jgi:VanZ family protein
MALIKKLLRNNSLWIFLWLLWMGVIFFFSQLPGNPTYYDPTILLLIERKGAHVAEYFLLFLLSTQFFSLVFFKETLRKIIALAFVWSVTYAVTDELHQFFTPYRGAHITDVLIDTLGISLALLLVLLFSWNKKKTLR